MVEAQVAGDDIRITVAVEVRHGQRLPPSGEAFEPGVGGGVGEPAASVEEQRRGHPLAGDEQVGGSGAIDVRPRGVGHGREPGQRGRPLTGRVHERSAIVSEQAASRVVPAARHRVAAHEQIGAAIAVVVSGGEDDAVSTLLQVDVRRLGEGAVPGVQEEPVPVLGTVQRRRVAGNRPDVVSPVAVDVEDHRCGRLGQGRVGREPGVGVEGAALALDVHGGGRVGAAAEDELIEPVAVQVACGQRDLFPAGRVGQQRGVRDGQARRVEGYGEQCRVRVREEGREGGRGCRRRQSARRRGPCVRRRGLRVLMVEGQDGVRGEARARLGGPVRPADIDRIHHRPLPESEMQHGLDRRLVSAGQVHLLHLPRPASRQRNARADPERIRRRAPQADRDVVRPAGLTGVVAVDERLFEHIAHDQIEIPVPVQVGVRRSGGVRRLVQSPIGCPIGEIQLPGVPEGVVRCPAAGHVPDQLEDDRRRCSSRRRLHLGETAGHVGVEIRVDAHAGHPVGHEQVLARVVVQIREQRRPAPVGARDACQMRDFGEHRHHAVRCTPVPL